MIFLAGRHIRNRARIGGMPRESIPDFCNSPAAYLNSQRKHRPAGDPVPMAFCVPLSYISAGPESTFLDCENPTVCSSDLLLSHHSASYLQEWKHPGRVAAALYPFPAWQLNPYLPIDTLGRIGRRENARCRKCGRPDPRVPARYIFRDLFRDLFRVRFQGFRSHARYIPAGQVRSSRIGIISQQICRDVSIAGGRPSHLTVVTSVTCEIGRSRAGMGGGPLCRLRAPGEGPFPGDIRGVTMSSPWRTSRTSASSGRLPGAKTGRRAMLMCWSSCRRTASRSGTSPRSPTSWRNSTGGRSTCSPSEGSILSSGRMWRARWSGVKRDEIFLRHMPAE